MALKFKNIEGKQIKKKAQQFEIALKNRKELQLQAKVSKTKKVRDVKSKFLISIVITVYKINIESQVGMQKFNLASIT